MALSPAGVSRIRRDGQSPSSTTSANKPPSRSHGGEPPGEREVRWATRPWLRLGGLFALVVEEGDWPSRRIRLTPAGESAMLAYLRSRAAGPRTGLFA